MPTDGCQTEGCTIEKTTNVSVLWKFDSQPLADNLLGTRQDWASAAMALDGAAEATDIAGEGMVVAATVAGFFGGTVEGTPVLGAAGAAAGWWMGQIAVRPAIFAGNILATAATAATAVADAKSGSNRLQAELNVSQGNVTASSDLSIGSATQLSVVTTGIGWLAPLQEMSLALQTVAVASDVGAVSTPWGSLNISFHWP